MADVLDAVNVSLIVLDRHARVVWLNGVGAAMLGRSSRDMAGRPIGEILASDEGRRRLASLLETLRPGACPETLEARVIARDGAVRAMLWSVAALSDVIHDSGSLLCTLVDATELRQTKLALARRSNELAERIKELNCVYAISKLVEDQSLVLEQILQGVVDLIPPAWQRPDATCARIRFNGLGIQTANFAETVQKQSREIVVRGEPVGVLDVYCLGGEPDRSTVPFLAEEESLLTVIAQRIGQIVELKQSAEVLRESEELHRMTLGNISDAVFITDEDGDFTYVCPNVHVLFGYSRREVESFGNIATLLGKHLFDRRSLAESGELANLHRKARDKSGAQHDLLVNVKEVSIKGGRILYTCRDVTELRRVQDQARRHEAELAHVSRLTTMGEMASGLAHELNQPLAAIINYANGCARRLESGESSAKDLANVMRLVASEAERAGEIMRRLRGFVRKGELRRTPVDVNRIIREAVDLARTDIRRYGVKLELQLTPDLPIVSADAIQIEQVILNLIRNALEAMAEIQDSDKQLEIRTSLGPDHLIEIAVSDTGKGISPETIDRVFHPFFTTKPEGVGIGLSIGKSIVEAHGGRMWVTTNPNRGVTFAFTLPA